MLSTAYVPAAEAAYIAGLSDRQLQRLFDENVLVDPFVVNQNGRFFTRISAAFAKFYFDLDDDLTASARRFVITQVCRRVLARSVAIARWGWRSVRVVRWTKCCTRARRSPRV